MSGFKPIVFNGSLRMVPRADLLFGHCGVCEMRLTWQPTGCSQFQASCCNMVYTALPAGIDLRYYQVGRYVRDMQNIRILHRPKGKPNE